MYVSLSLNAYPVKTPEPIFIIDGSKDVVWRAVVLLRQDNWKYLNLREPLPQNHPKFHQDGQFPAKKKQFFSHMPSKNGWTDFYGLWLERRGLQQGSAFRYFERTTRNCGGDIP